MVTLGDRIASVPSWYHRIEYSVGMDYEHFLVVAVK